MTEEPIETTSPAAPSITNPVQTFRETLGAELAGISLSVESRVLDVYVEKEVAKRADAIVKGLDALNSLDRELLKISRPDNQLFTLNGGVASEGYTKARLELIGKAEKSRGKLVKALDKALGGDMADLYNLNGGKPSSDMDDLGQPCM